MRHLQREDLYDVVIIGGGVIGCGIARQLSKYKLSVALCEAAEDVAMGASRANSGIVHAGYDAAPGSLMAKLNVRGNALYTSWCEELRVPLKRCGSLVIGITGQDLEELGKLHEMGTRNGVPRLSLISGDAARLIEPTLNPEVKNALHAPTAGITCPYEMTIAAFENARMNGVSFFLGTKVTGIEKNGDIFKLHTVKNGGGITLRPVENSAGNDAKNSAGSTQIEARYIINAAGLHADEIARMIGDDSFTIRPRKGEYMMLDHIRGGKALSTVIFQTPSPMGKGVLVSPTVDGNAYAGPTATDIDDKGDTATTPDGLLRLAELAVKSVPGIDLRSVITSFAGLRAVAADRDGGSDFIIRASEADDRVIHIAGICSPGLSSMPAIAEEAARLLGESGLDMPQNPRFIPYRQPITRFSDADWAERAALIEANPRYGHLICRCESVSEAEIIEAIHRGARTIDGVKRRTRAGMGRCQGGFCSPRVMEIISRETGIPMEDITKFGHGSKLLFGKLKEVGGYECVPVG